MYTIMKVAQKNSLRLSIYFLLLLPFVLIQEPWARADVQRFRLTPDASQIKANIDDPFGNVVNGKFKLKAGEARADVERLAETASVSLTIDAPSYNSNIGLRDQDVQEYYLKVKQYPTIRFESTGVVNTERPRSNTEPWLITFKGDLELHGVKREIQLPVRVLHQGSKIVAQGQFQLLLEKFNIAVPRLLFVKAGNTVQVDFRIVGERQP
jgi:polyisoprenoid-binding protein YceI